jgi:hypothetical protein
MAAQDTFHSFNASLYDAEKKQLSEFIKGQTQDLLMARSEDARTRLVQKYIQQINEILGEHH